MINMILKKKRKNSIKNEKLKSCKIIDCEKCDKYSYINDFDDNRFNRASKQNFESEFIENFYELIKF